MTLPISFPPPQPQAESGPYLRATVALAIKTTPVGGQCHKAHGSTWARSTTQKMWPSTVEEPAQAARLLGCQCSLPLAVGGPIAGLTDIGPLEWTKYGPVRIRASVSRDSRPARPRQQTTELVGVGVYATFVFFARGYSHRSFALKPIVSIEAVMNAACRPS